MKKFVAIISILALLFCLVSAFAEGIDLEKMETQDLLDLQMDVQRILLERDPMNSCFLYPGEYLIGRDFEPGSYYVECLNSENYGYIVAIDDPETGNRVAFNQFEEGDIYHFLFEDGMKVVVFHGVGSLIPN